MLSKEKGLELLQYIIKLSTAHGVDALVRIENYTLDLTRFANSEIHQNVSSVENTVTVKLIDNNKYIALKTTSVDEKSLADLVEEGCRKLKLLEGFGERILLCREPKSIIVDSFNVRIPANL